MCGGFNILNKTIKQYRLRNKRYPKNLDILYAQKNLDNLNEIPIDPWGRRYVYIYPSKYSGQEYDLASFGKDGVFGGDNENKDTFYSQKNQCICT